MNSKIIKLLSLILALLMVFALALTGCKKETASSDDDDEASSSSDSSSTPAPTTPVVNEEAKEIIEKYEFEMPDAKALWFADMDYVSLIAEEVGMLFFDQYGYEGEQILRAVHLIVSTRANLVKVGYIEEDTDEAIEGFFEELKSESEGEDAVTYYFDKDETTVVMAQIIEKNDNYYTFVFESTLSAVVAEALEYGAVLEFGEKSDYVKPDDETSSDDDGPTSEMGGGNDNGNEDTSEGGTVEVVTKEVNPEYTELLEKYGLSEPNVMVSSVNCAILAKETDGMGVEVYYYFAKTTGQVSAAMGYAIYTREAFAEMAGVENNDTAIKSAADSYVEAFKKMGLDSSAAYDAKSVTLHISVEQNYPDMDIDFIGKQLSDVVANEVADGAVLKFKDEF